MARKADKTADNRATMATIVAAAAVLGAISGLGAAGLTQTPTTESATQEKSAPPKSEITAQEAVETEPLPLSGRAEGGAQADRDRFNGLLVRARTSISQGQLNEAEEFLRDAAEIDPEGTALFNMRKLLDIAKASIESG